MYWLIESDKANDNGQNKWNNFMIKVPAEIKAMLANGNIEVALSQFFMAGIQSGQNIMCDIFMSICEVQVVNSVRLPLVRRVFIKEEGEVDIHNLHYITVANTLDDYVHVHIQCDKGTASILESDTREVKAILVFHFVQKNNGF